MGSIYTLFTLTLVTVGCNSLGDSTPTPESNSGGEYSWGDAGDSDSDADSDTDSDTDADTDSDTDADVETVTALIFIAPAAEWEASLDYSGAPDVCMYPVANETTNDWTGYGTTCAYEGDGEGYPYDAVTYVPGQILVVGADWFDGYSERYFADSGNTVRSRTEDWDGDGDEENVVVIMYSDSSFDMLTVDSTGTMTGDGYAYYVDSGIGHDIYLNTEDDDIGDYKL